MNKLLLLVIIFSSMIIMAQERSYIDFAPLMSWNSELYGEDQVKFGLKLEAHLMLGDNFAIRPFFDFISYKPKEDYWGQSDSNKNGLIQEFGMGFRYYFGKKDKED